MSEAPCVRDASQSRTATTSCGVTSAPRRAPIPSAFGGRLHTGRPLAASQVACSSSSFIARIRSSARFFLFSAIPIFCDSPSRCAAASSSAASFASDITQNEADRAAVSA